MQAQQLSVKLYLEGGDAVDQAALIPIFHRWIRERRLGEDKLLIDVADYRHVPDGPSVMIIADHAHYGLDEERPGVGVRVDMKRDALGELGDKLAEVFEEALAMAAALEDEPSLGGALKVAPGRARITVMSRLVAKNDAETHAEAAPIVAGFLDRLYGGAQVSTKATSEDPREPFAVEVEVEGAPDLATLRANLRTH